jgi:hypothetical protein
MKKYFRITVQSALLAVIGVYGVDYFSHLLFSSPMETVLYFLAKMGLYFIFSILFLSCMNLSRNEGWKVVISGIVVALIWGTYYNILPYVLDRYFSIDFYPFGIPLAGLTFLGLGLFGTGLAFGIVHTLAFIVGYYLSKFIIRILIPGTSHQQ